MKETVTVANFEAKPFLKWVGGKQQLLNQFEDFYPRTFNRYIEPFIGGGAVFFHLWSKGKLPKEIFLFDNNEELINVYKVVKDNIDELISVLSVHKDKHSKTYYYKIRNLDREAVKLSNIEKAARTIYLNKTCYNGLFRVNSKGQFNVPIGSYENPQIIYEDVLRSASNSLQGVNVAVKDFREIVDVASERDFIYFDPPYDPLSKTASFTSYTAIDFSEKDQQDLADLYNKLTEKGCLCMLSNSYTPFILELYKKFRIEIVLARRAVNSNGNGRGEIQEVVVLNYPIEGV